MNKYYDQFYTKINLSLNLLNFGADNSIRICVNSGILWRIVSCGIKKISNLFLIADLGDSLVLPYWNSRYFLDWKGIIQTFQFFSIFMPTGFWFSGHTGAKDGERSRGNGLERWWWWSSLRNPWVRLQYYERNGSQSTGSGGSSPGWTYSTLESSFPSGTPPVEYIVHTWQRIAYLLQRNRPSLTQTGVG